MNGAYPTEFSFQTAGLPAKNLAAAFTLSAMAEGAAYEITGFGHTYDAQNFTGSLQLRVQRDRTAHFGKPELRHRHRVAGGDFGRRDTVRTRLLVPTGSMSDSPVFAGGTVDFTFGFPQTSADQSLSLALNSVSPCWCISGTELRDFSATSTGSFWRRPNHQRRGRCSGSERLGLHDPGFRARGRADLAGAMLARPTSYEAA